MQKTKKKRAALVVSGGAALGAIELGVLSVLEDYYEFDFYAGTSIGSLIVAFAAKGYTAKQTLEIFSSTAIMKIMSDVAWNSGFLEGKAFEEHIEKHLENIQFEDIEAPVICTTTDFETGERADITTGSLSSAVRASCGVPVIFEPYYHEATKKWLVDGGLKQNFPIDTAIKQYQGDTIIGIDVTSFETGKIFKKGKKVSKKDQLERVFAIFMKNQIRDTDERCIVLQPPINGYSRADIRTDVLKKMYKSGRTWALGWAEGKLKNTSET